jgi:NAD(P)-dependent dehydrogenase (short-subunit alcohol dehydrogenase family)
LVPCPRPLLTLVSLIFVGFNGGVPVGDQSGVCFIGTNSSDAAQLARSLGAPDPITCPGAPAAESWTWDWSRALEAWMGEVGAIPETDQVVVCTWVDPVPDTALVDLDPVGWRRQVEWPTALWFTTLVAAAGRCRDGGSLVAVVDRPATLDAMGQSAAVTVAEGVVNVVRSLAAREGGRGMRVNAVLTSLHTDPVGLLGSPPPLATFPGRIDVEVAGAVRLLLGDDAAGITGTALAATAGRR